MLVLSVDTAGVMRTTCALWRGDGSQRSEGDQRDRAVWVGATLDQSPAECLAPAVQSLLQRMGVSIRDVTHLVCGIGPGPFTGLRIGLAHAHATAHALGLNATGVSSLAAVAWRLPGHARPPRFLVATDARRSEVYCAVFDSTGVQVTPSAVMTPAQAAAEHAPMLVLGDGAIKYESVFRAAGCDIADERALLSYEEGLMLAARDATAREPLPALPDYLREPDAVPTAERA